MTKDISNKVKKMVADHLGVDEAKVTEEANFIDDLGADSLDTVELVMAFEEEFGKVDEGYEDKKKVEVIKALKKKKPEFKKRYGKDAEDVMYAVAAKTAKKKGNTSKSDDRYAYEEVVNEEGADRLKDRRMERGGVVSSKHQ